MSRAARQPASVQEMSVIPAEVLDHAVSLDPLTASEEVSTRMNRVAGSGRTVIADELYVIERRESWSRSISLRRGSPVPRLPEKREAINHGA